MKFILQYFKKLGKTIQIKLVFLIIKYVNLNSSEGYPSIGLQIHNSVIRDEIKLKWTKFPNKSFLFQGIKLTISEFI